jgi:hypothetical protein
MPPRFTFETGDASILAGPETHGDSVAGIGDAGKKRSTLTGITDLGYNKSNSCHPRNPWFLAIPI